MKDRIQSLTRKPWALPAALAVLLMLGMALGIGVGHLARRPAVPPPVPATEPATNTVTEVPPAVPPEPPLPRVEDDANGPAEVVPEVLPPPPVAEVEEVKPPPVAPNPKPKSVSGKPAWQRYAVPFAAPAGRPMIVVVIDDLGLDKRRTKRAMDLPAPLTLSFMTYADDLAAMTATAHERGHELLEHMPMQAMSNHFNAGPNALEVGLPTEELQRRIQWGLDRFTGYVGVNNHMGSRFTADPEGMKVVMQEMKQHGLMFLDSVTTDHSAAPEAARQYGVPFAQRQVFLDNEQTLDTIREQLAKTEAIARKHGQAICIGHPHDTTLTALAEWLPGLEAKGFSMVPLTTLMKEHKP